MNPNKWMALYFGVFVACTIGFAILSSNHFDEMYAARVQRGEAFALGHIQITWCVWSLGFGLFCGMIFCFAHAYLLTRTQGKIQ